MENDLEYIYLVQKKAALLQGIMALLSWDEKTHMPNDAIMERADQLKLLQDEIYMLLTSRKLSSALCRLRNQRLASRHRMIITELHKDTQKLRRIPKEFLERLTRAETIASQAWEKARKKDDYSLFAPHLKRLISLKRKEAGYLNPKLKPYDALLDEHEEGMRESRLTDLFSYLKEELVALLKKVQETKAYKNHKELELDMPKEAQESLYHELVRKMQADGEALSIDCSAHPFTTRISAHDVRITTRYLNPLEALFSTVHEAGHALYEQNLPSGFRDTVIYNAPSMGIHESQSRLWENVIFRSSEFWDGYHDEFISHAKKKIQKSSLFKGINQVRPSLIRVQADEITYCLHIILRFEMERDLISGKVPAKDARSVWNKRTKSMFGLKPGSDNQGILQDMHWSLGAFGYFPSYAIGTIYASQIYKAMEKGIPNIRKHIMSRDFKSIVDWLTKNIHSKGRTMTAEQIIRKATGSGLDPKIYIDYLHDKYSKIYRFD